MGSNHTQQGSRQRAASRVAGAIVITAVVALTACSAADDDSAGVDDVGGDFSAEQAATEASAVAEAAPADAGEAMNDAAAASEGDGDFDIGAIGRDVIVEMRVVLRSDDIHRTVSSIMATTASLGGGLASSDVDYGPRRDTGNEDGSAGGEPVDPGYAVLVVKVPPESVDRLIDGLDSTATVESINQSAQDVTEQLVDLDVRIANARQSVSNVREFMDRAEDLTDLVTLEGELTRRQTELERLEAQQRNLSERVALATVTIEVVPTAVVLESVDDEPDGIAEAFDRGWGAFVTVLFGLAFVLAVLTPFLLIAAVLGSTVWLILRTGRASRRRRPETSGATDPVSEEGDDQNDDRCVSASRPE